MRRFQTGYAIPVPAGRTVRNRYAIPTPTCVPVPIWGGLRMPATTADIEKLRSLLRYLRAPESHMPDSERLKLSLGGMETALALLENNTGGTIKDFLISAFLTAHIETGPGRWTLHDPDLRNWVLGEASKLPYVKQ